MNKRILHLIQQSGMLMQMPRSHNRNLGYSYDTVASHSFHVALIAYCISRMEGCTHEEGLQAIAMGIFHDLAEARTGDLDFISKNYAVVDEEKAVEDQFANIEFGDDMKKVVEEYEERQTLVSKCAKDADAVEQVYQEWVLSWQGHRLAEKWFQGDFIHRLPSLRTESAKKLLLSMRDSNPHEWWWSEFVDKDINYDHLNSKK
jgi:putative hydrolases of HD superfamily